MRKTLTTTCLVLLAGTQILPAVQKPAKTQAAKQRAARAQAARQKAAQERKRKHSFDYRFPAGVKQTPDSEKRLDAAL